MNIDTIDVVNLAHLVSTTLLLRMAHHNQMKAMDVLQNIQTIIVGIEYKIDYIFFWL